MTTPAGITVSQNVSLWPWVGADNTNHFFTPEELFNPNESSTLFVNSLLAAGATNNIYENYTFYRLLSQLGTDSQPESGKMNLNYVNAAVYTNASGAITNIVIIPNAETNFIPWTNAVEFFTVAADRLLRAYTTQWRNSNPTNFANTFYTVTNFNFAQTNWANYPAFGIGNVPVLVSNQFVYSSAVNRLLQLAANLYDATTTNFYPHIFRPVFSRDTNASGVAGLGTNVYITGYVPQTLYIVQGNETNSPDLALPIDAFVLAATNIVVTNLAVNVYGVPWIIGAKKGFPNFNEFSLESAFQITRKLQFTRNTNTWQYASNQMYIMSITNFYGVECWNSYSTSYPRTGTGPVSILARANMTIYLTNYDDASFSPLFLTVPNLAIQTISSWPGYNTVGTSFKLPFGTSAYVLWLTNSVYNYGPNVPPNIPSPYNAIPGFVPTLLDPSNYWNTGTPPVPHFGLMATNRLQVAIIDYSAGVNKGQIIDYVQLNGMDSSRDLNAEIADPDDYGMWSTNMTNGVPLGVYNQVHYSRYGSPSLPQEDADDGFTWTAVSGFNPPSPAAEQTYFNKFFGKNLTTIIAIGGKTYTATYTSTNLQAAFTPTRTRVQRLTWQANDPLVHYMTSDLTDTIDDTNGQHIVDWAQWPGILGQPNHRYMPWGGYPGTIPNMYAPDFNAANATNLAVKDPNVSSSDFWDFPTNKFPTVGWLGRVHRGTPWQTVYLKASPTGVTNWMTWTGNQNSYDAINAAPGQDRLLFDLFTTAFNDNATRGTLSVNVGATNGPSLAAWSALFSGVVVPTNLVGGYTIISPAGTLGAGSQLGQLVSSINQTRANTNLFPLQTFEHVGDILAVPALTEKSPFLAGLSPNTPISDELMEWLPQQVMSLLRCSSSPRYVIYCYGQTLKPAPDSIVTSGGQYFGMITNYQVVSEIATRAVVRFGSVLTNNIVFDVNTTNWVSRPVMTNNNAVIESFNILPPD
jgi:hypothetical protein